MTNEEIEEQAVEYATQNYGTEDVVQSDLLQAISKDSFKDGAKWMQEHAIEWHDLRKDPNDLPKETKDYIIYHEDNAGFCHYSIRRFSHNYFDCTNTILAWCELPTYKE